MNEESDNDSPFQLAAEIELEEGGQQDNVQNQTAAAQSAMVGDQSMEQLQGPRQGYDQNNMVASGLSTSPARKLKGESVPAGQLLDFSFANLAWQDKGNSKLKCWQTLSIVRNLCFVILIGVAVFIAFFLPTSNEGNVKSINSFISTQPFSKKSVKLADMAFHHLTFFPDKSDLTTKLGSSDLDTELCTYIRSGIVQETTKGKQLFLSDCKVMIDGDKVLVHNNLKKFKAYEIADSVEEIHDLSISDIQKSKSSSLDSLEFNDANEHFVMLIQNYKKLKLAKITKTIFLRAQEDFPSKSTYKTAEINEFINKNDVILQLRKPQTLSKEKIKVETITLNIKKIVNKFSGSDVNISEEEKLHIEFLGSYFQLSGVKATDAHINDIELPLKLNMREMVTEYEQFGLYDYMKDVGSYLALAFILVLLMFQLVGLIFVSKFVTQFKELIQRKYLQANYMHMIQKHLKKFDQIHQALYDRKDEEEYKEIFNELEFYLTKNYEDMRFLEVEKHFQKMEILDQKLPDIDDVEDMLSAVRFQQPAAQKQMNKRINRVIHDRTNLSLGQIAGLMKERLSFYGLFKLHDEVELNTAKMKSEMYIQNEKLEFLFKTLAERSERRSTRKRQKSIKKRKTMIEKEQE